MADPDWKAPAAADSSSKTTNTTMKEDKKLSNTTSVDEAVAPSKEETKSSNQSTAADSQLATDPAAVVTATTTTQQDTELASSSPEGKAQTTDQSTTTETSAAAAPDPAPDPATAPTTTQPATSPAAEAAAAAEPGSTEVTSTPKSTGSEPSAAEGPPLIIVGENDSSVGEAPAPVVRTRSEEESTTMSQQQQPATVVRTHSDEQHGGNRSASETEGTATMGAATGTSAPAPAPPAPAPATTAPATTKPPTLQNHASAGSDDDGLDEFIKSPHGQNAIVERSPGGRYVRFMEKLGSGASKDVYRAYDTQEGIEVAWNVVSLSGLPKTDRNRIVNEVRLLERLHHHNIISFHGTWVNRERQEVHFVTEILSSGTLKSFINKVQVIRWKIAKRWAVQILKGLEYLHSQSPPVIHRDLKCENIFINGTSGDLRIGDLGLSTVHHNGRVLSVLGTPEFMAPDMYEENSYDQRVDIYAFGMCMLEIFTKEIPYKECKNPAQIYKKVSNGELPESLSRLRSKHARDFIMLCLGYKDENGEYVRPTAKELLTHEFLVKRANDEDEVLVDPPLIKRTIAENDNVSPIPTAGGGGGGATAAAATKNHVQQQQQAAPKTKTTETVVVEKTPSVTPAKSDNTDQGSADGDESDRFDEMPDSEVNIRKVKVLMGRGQELKEDEEPRQEPLADTSSKSVEGSMHSHNSTDRMVEPSNPVIKNGVPAPALRSSKKGHYLVAAAVIENEAALAYPDDILKLVVTLPVEGQTQNVQFDFHLVEDDPVQVGKEMVSELGIPQGAVLEISETISGLACAARMQRDKHKMRAQQNAQVVPQSQHMMPSPQVNLGPQDMQSGMTMQQQPPMASPEFPNGQPMHQQQSQSSDQIQRPPSQQPQSQLSQPPNTSQPNQISADAQSAPSSYGHMQNQNHVQQQHQMPGQMQNQQQMNQGNHIIQDPQSQQMPQFGYDPNPSKMAQPQQQPIGQHGNSITMETQSLPAYGYEGGRSPNENQLPPQPSGYSYDPGQAQNQQPQHQGQPQQMQPQHHVQPQQMPPQHPGQPQQMQPQHQGQPQGQPQQMQPQHLHQKQSGIPEVQQQNAFRYDGQQQQQPQQQQQQQQQQHQGQLNQSLAQQAPIHMGQQQNQMPPQQTGLQNQGQQPQLQQNQMMQQQAPVQNQAPQQQQQPQMQQVMQAHPGSQQHGNNPMSQAPQMNQNVAQGAPAQQHGNNPVQQVPQMQNQLNQGVTQGQPQQPGNNPIPQSSQMQNQGVMQGQPQTFGHVPIQNASSQAQPLQQQQQQQQQQSQPQQLPYPSSPLQQTQQQQQQQASNVAEAAYEHGVSLPNASSQRIGIPAPAGGAMKRSVSTNSHSIPNSQQQQQQQRNIPLPGAPINMVGSEKVNIAPTGLPPSRSNSGHVPAVQQQQQQQSDAGIPLPHEIASATSLPVATVAGTGLVGSDSSEGDADDMNEELRKLDEDFQKNLQRAKKVFDNRMDNLQRSQIEREAQHQKTLEKHQKERADFEKRLQQEEKEQNRRIEQLQREWDRRREVLSKNKRKTSEEEGSISAEASLSSSPDTGYTMPPSNVNNVPEHSLNQTMSNDSDR